MPGAAESSKEGGGEERGHGGGKLHLGGSAFVHEAVTRQRRAKLKALLTIN